jgi:hypothetical protein
MSIRPRITFDFVKPKIGGDVANIGLSSAVSNYFNLSYSADPTKSNTPKNSGTVWQEFALNLSIGDMLSEPDLKNINNFLKNVNTVIQKLTDILKIIRLLTNDLKSVSAAFKFAIKTIVILLKEFLDSFSSSGLYWCLVTPDKHEKDHSFIVPTWGSFEEFKRKIAAACTDIENPGSPARLNAATTVGGVVIGGIYGKNDPKAVDSFIYNMQLLGKLFDYFDASVTGSPKGVKAVSGIYNKKIGIQVSWNKVNSDFVTGYRVYRCQSKNGVLLLPDELEKIFTSFFRPGNAADIDKYSKIKVYDNDKVYATGGKKFNNGNPLTVLSTPASQNFSIVDYDVVEGEVYYYKVFSIPGAGALIFDNPYNARVDSPLASVAVGTKAFSNCISISEISQGILSKEGDFIDEKNLKYKWNFMTIRKFLGSTFDKELFGNIDLFADKLLGMVSTSSDAVNDYLSFFSKKIQSYITILNTIVQIVEILVNFRLRGSVLLLNVPAKTGGIQYFTNTVMSSSVDSNTFGYPNQNNGGAALETIEGFYFGWVIVYGVTDPSNYNQLIQPYKAEYNSVVAQLNANQKAISTLTKLLVG